MAASDAVPKTEDRLSIRADAAQKRTLRRAAEARHMNVSQFVLQSSLKEAERVLEEETRLAVSAEEYESLSRLMDAPPRELPELRDLVRRRPVWDA